MALVGTGSEGGSALNFLRCQTQGCGYSAAVVVRQAWITPSTVQVERAAEQDERVERAALWQRAAEREARRRADLRHALAVRQDARRAADAATLADILARIGTSRFGHDGAPGVWDDAR